MPETYPLVSFVIPTHNRANLLKECLDSILNQTYKNIEAIVVNDRSSDNTINLLTEYCSRYKNFYWFNNEGEGGNAARNLGILKANGEYIAFMDDDDICEPFRIEEQLRPIVQSNFHWNFIISGFKTIDFDGNNGRTYNYLKPNMSVGYPQRWLVKKEILINANYFDTEQPALQDIEFYFRLKDISRIYFNPVPVVIIRNSSTSITRDHIKMNAGILRLILLHGHKMSTFENNHWYITLCKKYASLGDWKNYKLFLKRINKFRLPFSFISLSISYYFKSKYVLKLHTRLSIMFFNFKGVFTKFV